MNTVFSYYDIYLDVLNYIAGMSLLTITFMFIASYLLRFCAYHRSLLWYLVLHKAIEIIDYNIGIPVSDFCTLGIYLSIAGAAIILTVILYVKYGDRELIECY